MPDQFNRLQGARSIFGIKKPVRAASTTNLTLSGFQTVDGVAYAEGDDALGRNMRILVKDQTAAEQNGIYYVTSSGWQRDKDFDGNTDYCKGSLVYVTDGDTYGGRFYNVTAEDPPAVGTEDPEFDRIDLDVWTRNVTVASAASLDLSDVDGDYVTITGTTNITSFTLGIDKMRILRFEDVLTITGGGNGLDFPDGITSFTTRAGDIMIVRGEAAGAGNARVISILRFDGEWLTTGELTVTAAATVSLGLNSAGTASVYEHAYLVTGNTGITSFSTAASTGAIFHVRFSGTPLITHSANLLLPGSQNIQVIAGDSLIAKYEGSSVWRVISYTRGNSRSLSVGDATVASAATTDIGAVREQTINITGTTGITSFGSSAAAGDVRFLRFAGALTLTHSSNLICPASSNIVTAAGDQVIAKYEGSGVWRLLNYARTNLLWEPNTASTSNSSTSAESDLLTYTIPASRLASSVYGLKLTAWGRTAATTDTKRVRLYFGATVVADSSAPVLNNQDWRLEAIIARTTAASAQKASGVAMFSSSPIVLTSTPAENSTAAIVAKVTGLATGTTADITAHGFIVENYPV